MDPLFIRFFKKMQEVGDPIVVDATMSVFEPTKTYVTRTSI